MKNLRVYIAVAIAFACLPISAISQGGLYTDFAWKTASNTPPGAQTPIYAVPGAKGTVCLDLNCTSQATIYSNVSLTGSPITQPFTADQTGGLTSNSLSMSLTGLKVGANPVATSVASPVVNRSACVKSAGPPIQFGYCSTVVASDGSCTCN